MSKIRQPLGRGLNALIPSGPGPSRPSDAPAAAHALPAAHMLPVGEIQPNPDQPRSHLDSTALEELAASIREHGVLQPILVRRSQDHGYVLVAGERRWRAAQLAGLAEVPAIVTDIASADVLTVALVENLQRQDLGPLEEAHAYSRLIERSGLTQEQLAKSVGKSRAAVTNALRLLQLPTAIRLSLAAGEISEGHARAILGAPGEEQRLRLWERVRRHNLTVRQTEQATRGLRAPAADAPAPAARELPGDVLAQQRLQVALGTRVRVERARKGGKIVIRWYDDEQLEALVAAIVRAQTAAEPHPAIPESIAV